MLSHYYKAKTLTAKIHMVQSALNKSLSFDTFLAYERPQKIALTQRRSNDSSYAPKLVSDGVTFAYTIPSSFENRSVKGLKETTHPKVGQINIEEMWPAVKSQFAHGDLSFALIAMISRQYDLREVVPQFVNISNHGLVKFGDRSAYDIEGIYKDSFNGEGTFSMFITEDGDLLREELKLNFAVDAKYYVTHHINPSDMPNGIETDTVWVVNAQIDQPVDESLFKVPSDADVSSGRF